MAVMGVAQRGGDLPERSGRSEGPSLREAAAGGELARSGAPGGHGQDLQLAIEQLRARVDEEFRISERLDAKARGAFALAAGFFAVIQTVAAPTFGDGGVALGLRGLLAGVAVVAGGAVVGAAWLLVRHMELGSEDDLKPSAIERWAKESSDEHYVGRKLVVELARVAEDRFEKNKGRADRYRDLQNCVVAAIGVTGLELIGAILLRLA